jgi:hypothetical protein
MTRDIMYRHLDQHSTATGFHVPELLAWYLSDLLAERISRVDIIPEPSFGQRYLALYQQHSVMEYKDYADSALFFVSLMPEYGRRRGLDMTYYASLGISTYYALSDLSEDPRYTQLGNWFYHLQRFLHTALRPEQRLDFSVLG